MSSDIPHKSPVEPVRLKETDQLKFRCHRNIKCWNQCCNSADVTLTPYDLLRLKHALNVDSSTLLKEHTVPFEMDAHKVPGIKLRTNNDGACLFVTEEGCSVYADRPTACRYYPAGQLTSKNAEEKSEQQHLVLIKEEHCFGHHEQQTQTLDAYRKEQKVAEFDQENHAYYQLILKKKSAGPSVGAPTEMSLQLFFMVCYDLDRFRRFVSSDSFAKTYELTSEQSQLLQDDDLELLRFGYGFLKQVLFGEDAVPMREGAAKKRFEERKEILQARHEAELQQWREEQARRERGE